MVLLPLRNLFFFFLHCSYGKQCVLKTTSHIISDCFCNVLLGRASLLICLMIVFTRTRHFPSAYTFSLFQTLNNISLFTSILRFFPSFHSPRLLTSSAHWFEEPHFLKFQEPHSWLNVIFRNVPLTFSTCRCQSLASWRIDRTSVPHSLHDIMTSGCVDQNNPP